MEVDFGRPIENYKTYGSGLVLQTVNISTTYYILPLFINNLRHYISLLWTIVNTTLVGKYGKQSSNSKYKTSVTRLTGHIR